MDIFEAIVVGLQFKRLQHPLIFVAMLVAFLVFSAGGIITLYLSALAILTPTSNITFGVGAFLGSMGLALLFFLLAWLSAHMLKRCIRSASQRID